MGFTTPALLWALPIAAIPLAIYLLLRWRRRDVEWGSIWVLRRVLETRSRFRAWLQYAVVALRTLALLAVVLALAGLVGRRPAPDPESFPSPPPTTHRVVLFDNSASMAARQGDSTRLESALALCRRMIRAGVAPGRLDLVPLAGGREPISFESFPVSLAAVEEGLSAAATPLGRADFAAGLRRAADILRGGRGDRRELYILSDFAAVNFSGDGPDPADVEEIRTRLARLAGAGVAVRCLRCDAPRTANFALLAFTPHADLLLAGQPTPFRVTVGFSGNVPEGESVLSIEADRGTPAARVLHEQPLAMTPGEQTITVPLALPSGRHTLTALLRPDDLPSDDALTRSFEVAARLRVVLVQDVGAARGFDDPRTWLEMALADTEPAGGGAGPAAAAGGDTRSRALAEAAARVQDQEFAAGDDAAAGVRIALEGKIPEQLNPELLAGVDLLIVSGVGRIGPEAVEAIRRYAARGGVVLLAPEPGQKVAEFNASWEMVAPARLAAARWNAVDPERHESCAAESLAAPLWRELESTEHGNLANARFYNHFTLEPGSPADGREVLLSVGDGDPLLVERRLGRGGVLLWTAGLSHQWHSLVVHPGFPVFLIRLAALAADRSRFPINVAAGEPLVLSTDAAQVRIVRPDGDSEVVPTVASGDDRFVRYPRTDRAGTYDVREDVESQLAGRLFTVARDDGFESDLRPAAGRVRDVLETAAGAAWFESEPLLAEAVRRDYPGPSWVLPMALAMLAGLIGEAAVSRWLLA